MSTTPYDEFFDYQEMAPGVHVGVARPNAKVICNAAIIDLGGEAVVVDTQCRPSAARAVRSFAEMRLGLTVRHIVNTHHHWDHWQGNSAYVGDDVAIYAHPETRRRIASHGERMLTAQVETAAADIAAAVTADGQSADPDAVRRLDQLRDYATELPSISVLSPQHPVATEHVVTGAHRAVRLVHPGPAHTSGDLVVVVEDAGVVVTGDCVIGWTPFMGDARPDEWADSLDIVAGLGDRFVMGHGRPADVTWVRYFQSYLRAVVDETRRNRGAGKPDDVGVAVRARLEDRFRGRFDAHDPVNRPWRRLVMANVAHICRYLDHGSG